MRESPLKVAVLGLNDTGRLMLDAASGLDYFKVTAVADSDAKLAGRSPRNTTAPLMTITAS